MNRYWVKRLRADLHILVPSTVVLSKINSNSH